MNSFNLLRCFKICFLAGLLGGALACASRPPAEPEASSKPEAARPVGELIAEADKLYGQREDLARVRESIALLRRARAADLSNYEAAWKMARDCYYLASHTPDKNESDTVFRQGVAAGQEAVKLQPNKPDGHFWLGANLGARAENQEVLTAVTSVGDIRREMETVLKLDEGYQSGSAYMALGQLEEEVPETFGGDHKKAAELMEKGLQFGPNNALLRLHLAEVYYDLKRPDDARKQLNTILSMPVDPEYVPEDKEAKEKAKKMLEEHRG